MRHTYIQWRSSHYVVTVVRNKNGNIQGRSHNVVIVIFHTIRNCSKRKEFKTGQSLNCFFFSHCGSKLILVYFGVNCFIGAYTSLTDCLREYENIFAFARI